MASLKHKSSEQLLHEIGERLAELLYRNHDTKSKEHASSKPVKITG